MDNFIQPPEKPKSKFSEKIFWGMKCCLLSLGLLLALSAQAQRQIVFQPDLRTTARRSDDSQSGTVRADPLSPDNEYRLMLPIGSWRVRFYPSSLKQYQSVFIGQQWQPSQASVWIGESPEDATLRVIVVAIAGKLQHLLLQQAGNLYRLDPLNETAFVFADVRNDSGFLSRQCGMRQLVQPVASSPARLAGNSCRVVDLALVTDLGVNMLDISSIEAQLIAWVMAAQAYFNVSFDAELNLQIRALFIPTTESPFPNELKSGFGDVNYSMKNWLLAHHHPAGEFDVTVGMTKYDYETPGNIGYMFGDPASLGTIVLEIQPSLTVALLTHELGHAFGASHDAQDFTYIMSPTISPTGRWSEQSKSAVNTYLGREDVKTRLRECPILRFSGELAGEAIRLTWEATYEQGVAAYVLKYGEGSQDQVIDSVAAVGSSTGPVQYEFVHRSPSPGRNIYRLSQYSSFGVLMDSKSLLVENGPGVTTHSTVWPNPFSESVQVVGQGIGEEVEVFDGLGRILLRQTLTQPSLSLPTANWPPGLYLVRLNGRSLKVIKH